LGCVVFARGAFERVVAAGGQAHGAVAKLQSLLDGDALTPDSSSI